MYAINHYLNHNACQAFGGFVAPDTTLRIREINMGKMEPWN